MTTILAAEGGYQPFTLGGQEWFWLVFSAVTALLAIVVGFSLMRGVLAADQGTAKMKEIAAAIQEGALAYLKRQFRTIGFILIPLVVVVFVTSTAKPSRVAAPAVEARPRNPRAKSRGRNMRIIKDLHGGWSRGWGQR